MRKLSGMMRRRYCMADVDFGKVYSNAEIAPIQSQVNTYQNKLKAAEAALKLYNVQNVIEDLPKLSPYEREKYKQAKSDASIAKRELNQLLPKLNWMKLSQELPRTQPNAFDILKYSMSVDKTPTEVLDEYHDKYYHVFYPQYIEAMARANMAYHRTFVHADDTRPLSYYLDEAVKSEDEKHGEGKTPIADLVADNKKKYKLLKEGVEILEREYVGDAVRDHVGVGTRYFNSEDIQKILNETPISPDTIPMPEIFDATPTTGFSGMGYPPEVFEDQFTFDQYEMGFFKKLFKAVLSPLQKFQQSIFSVVIDNTIKSSLVRKNIPSSLYNNLVGLSESSAKMLAGKISKDNIRNSIKYSMRLAAEGGRPFAELTRMQYNALMSTGLGRDLDKYSGGLATSYMNLAMVSKDAASGAKIDYTARAIDALKIAAAVSAGAGAVAISTGTQAVGEKTGLSQTSLGRTVLTVGSTAAGGGDVSTVSKSLISKSATKQAEKVVAPVLQSALGQTAGSMVFSAATGAMLSPTPQETFFETLGKEAQKEGEKRVLAKVDELTGGKLSDVQKGYEVYQKASKYKDMTPEEFEKNLQEERARFEKKIEHEIMTAKNDVMNYEQKLEKERNRIIAQYDDFDAQREIAELEKGAQKEILEQEQRLAKNLDQMQADYEKGLNIVSNQVETFDAKKFAEDEARRLKERIAAEKDRFLINANDIAFGLAKKYGPQLLAYLMWKYGPQPSYDHLLTEIDMQAYETWTPPKTGLVKRKGGGLGLLAALGAGAVAVYAMS